MNISKNLKIVLCCFLPLVALAIIIPSFLAIVSCSRTHNRVYFSDLYRESTFDLRIKLEDYRPAGHEYYFSCAQTLSQLKEEITDQMSEAEITEYGESLIICYNNGYYCLKENSAMENGFVLSDMAQGFLDETDASLVFLLPYHLVDRAQIPSSFNSGDTFGTAASYAEWKNFYSAIDCAVDIRTNDGYKEIFVPLVNSRGATIKDFCVILQFLDDGTICVFKDNIVVPV